MHLCLTVFICSSPCFVIICDYFNTDFSLGLNSYWRNLSNIYIYYHSKDWSWLDFMFLKEVSYQCCIYLIKYQIVKP